MNLMQPCTFLRRQSIDFKVKFTACSSTAHFKDTFAILLLLASAEKN